MTITYGYVPANSCHPESTFSSMKLAELRRIQRNCPRVSDRLNEADFFTRKINERGHELPYSRAGLTQEAPKKLTTVNGKRTVAVKLDHTSTLNTRTIMRTLEFYRPLLGNIANLINIIPSLMLSENMKRKLHKLNWQVVT